MISVPGGVYEYTPLHLASAKGFRRLKAYKQLPILRAALVTHAAKHLVTKNVEPHADVA